MQRKNRLSRLEPTGRIISATEMSDAGLEQAIASSDEEAARELKTKGVISDETLMRIAGFVAR